MSLPQSICVALGHSEELEVALVLELSECLEGLLEGNVGRNARRLEQVHLLDTAELLVDSRDTTPEVLCATGTSGHPQYI